MKRWTNLTAAVLSGGLAIAALTIGASIAYLGASPATQIRATGATPILRSSEFVPPRPYQIPAEQLAEWQKSASESERRYIEDGVVTFEEYESAVFETVRCIEEAGITVVHSTGYGRSQEMVEGVRLSRHGIYQFVGRIPSYDGSRPTAELDAINRCRVGSAQIQFLWAQHTAPSDVELQAMRDHMAVCLERLGADVGDRPADQDLQQHKAEVGFEAYMTCQFAAADAYEFDRAPG
jgi:hypothetical protein